MTETILTEQVCQDLFFDEIWLDVTETINAVHRTGVQRVLSQVIAAAGNNRKIVAFSIASDGNIIVHSQAMLNILGTRLFSELNFEKIRQEIGEISNNYLCKTDKSILLSARAIVNLEVFFDASRAELYKYLIENIKERVFFLIYDIIPLLQPHYLKHHMPFGMEYFRFCLHVENIATISSLTRDQLGQYFHRQDQHNLEVITLGADSFTPRPNSVAFDPAAPPLFVVVGTITDRKGHLRVLTLFQALWRENHAVKLVFLGRTDGATSAPLFSLMAEVAANPHQFEWINAPGDDDISDYLSRARGSIYVSDGEGFGLGPLESLFCGVPTIVRADYPALADVTPHGQTRVGPYDDTELRQAILDFLDDGFYAAKRAELSDLTLKTWRDFGEGVNRWIERRTGALENIDRLGFSDLTEGWWHSSDLEAAKGLWNGSARQFIAAGRQLGFEMDQWLRSGRVKSLATLRLTERIRLIIDLVHFNVMLGQIEIRLATRCLLSCLAFRFSRQDSGRQADRLYQELLSIEIENGPDTESDLNAHLTQITYLDHLAGLADAIERASASNNEDYLTCLLAILANGPTDLGLWYEFRRFIHKSPGSCRKALLRGMFLRPFAIDGDWNYWVALLSAAATALEDKSWGKNQTASGDITPLLKIAHPAVNNVLAEALSPIAALRMAFDAALLLPENAPIEQIFACLSGGRYPDPEETEALRDLRDAGAMRPALIAFVADKVLKLEPEDKTAINLWAAQKIATAMMQLDPRMSRDTVFKGYINLLFRRPDEGGLQHFADYLENTGDIFSWLLNMSGTLEARKNYRGLMFDTISINFRRDPFRSLPLEKNVAQLLKAKQDHEFARQLFRRLLGRTATSAEINLVEHCFSLGVGREYQVAKLLQGLEFRHRITAPADLEATYRLLGLSVLENCKKMSTLLHRDHFSIFCHRQLRGDTALPIGKIPLDAASQDWRNILLATAHLTGAESVFREPFFSILDDVRHQRSMHVAPLAERIDFLLQSDDTTFSAWSIESLQGRIPDIRERERLSHLLSLGVPKVTLICMLVGTFQVTKPAHGAGNIAFERVISRICQGMLDQVWPDSEEDAPIGTIVDRAYLALLARPGDPGGRAHFIELLGSLPRHEWLSLGNALVGAPEFAGRFGEPAKACLHDLINAALHRNRQAAASAGSQLQPSIS